MGATYLLSFDTAILSETVKRQSNHFQDFLFIRNPDRVQAVCFPEEETETQTEWKWSRIYSRDSSICSTRAPNQTDFFFNSKGTLTCYNQLDGIFPVFSFLGLCISTSDLQPYSSNPGWVLVQSKLYQGWGFCGCCST